MPYEDRLPKTFPPPLQGKAPKFWGTRLGQVVGRRMDVTVQYVRDGVLSRIPSPTAATDTLEQIGLERGLPRQPGEINVDYAAYLRRAWEVWGGDDDPLSTTPGGGAGSPLGLLNALGRAGIDNGPDGAMIVYQTGRYVTGDGGGGQQLGVLDECINRIDLTGTVLPRPGWTFDARDNFWSVFGIVFPEDVTVDPATLNATVNKWRPSKTLYIGAWVLVAGCLWDWPTGKTWDGGLFWDDAEARFIPPSDGDDVRIGYAFNDP